jgi:hypothetical protein
MISVLGGEVKTQYPDNLIFTAVFASVERFNLPKGAAFTSHPPSRTLMEMPPTTR